MDSGDENDDSYGETGGKDWRKVDRDLMTEGYREGLDEARNEELQKYFELAQQLIFKNSFRLGQLKGILLCRVQIALNGDVPAPLKKILEDLDEETKRIKQLQLPAGTDYDEFVKGASEDMDQRFETLKRRLLVEDPKCQVHIDSLEVGTKWPTFKPAEVPKNNSTHE